MRIDPYTCTAVCALRITLEGLTAAIGPAGDAVYVPMRITGGSVTGMGAAKRIIGGCDFAVMFADEKLVHGGRFVVSDPAGDILIWYEGVSQGPEGTYDEILEGRLPACIPSRLAVRTASTNAAWHSLNRGPLLAMGVFAGDTGTLEVTVLSVAGNDAGA